MQTIDQLRQQNIAVELYPDAVKMGKQMSYADKRNIPYVAILGEQEITQQTITLKSMQSGEQWTLSMTELINHLGEKL